MIPTRTPVSFIASDRPDQARDFYGTVLGLELVETTDYALVFAEGDHVLRIQIVAELCPADHTVHGWQTTDIQSEITALNAKGVQCVQFDQLPQDDHGVWTTPDGHKIAWFKDPCGNVLSLTEFRRPKS